jgi:hypothetical protein
MEDDMMEKTPEELISERKKRVFDAIQLKVPDRVPINAVSGFFAARYAGFTGKEVMYDREKTMEATLRYVLDFQPDLGDNPFFVVFLGPMLEAIGYKNLLWAGHGLNDRGSYQFLEKEVMAMDEYDEYLFDPTDFVIRKVWPRIYSPLKHFEKLSPLNDVFDFITSILKIGSFADTEVRSSMEALYQTGLRIQERLDDSVMFDNKLKDLGFPTIIGSVSQAPFDYFSDFLRGTKGSLSDMYRVPEKVLAMVEKMFPLMLSVGLKAKDTGLPGVFIPLHKCLDGFMSQNQFRRFYWPSLKRLIESFIDESLIPIVLWEGHCDSRLEIIGDIPAGKAVYYFEQTDLFKAKEVLGDVVCLQGNVPLTMLTAGTPDDVRNYCKKLIKAVGKGGGFIMAPSTALDDAKIENVKAMFETTKEYGIYG